MTEHEAKLRDELDAVEARIKVLEVGKYHMGFCVGRITLEELFTKHLSAKVLSQIQDQLNRHEGAISEEAHCWLEEARANLGQFAEYMLALESKLIAQAEEIEEQLGDLEHHGNQTQSEMNADANASMDRQR